MNQNIKPETMGHFLPAVEENLKICKSDKDSVSLCMNENGEWYDIAFSQCKTSKEITYWVRQLCEKQWVTTNHISSFMAHVFNRFPDLKP